MSQNDEGITNLGYDARTEDAVAVTAPQLSPHSHSGGIHIFQTSHFLD